MLTAVSVEFSFIKMLGVVWVLAGWASDFSAERLTDGCWDGVFIDVAGMAHTRAGM